MQSMIYESKYIPQNTMYKPSEPLSDGGEDSNLNSPIFGRRNMEDYFYDWGDNNKEEEENEYSGRMSSYLFIMLFISFYTCVLF